MKRKRKNKEASEEEVKKARVAALGRKRGRPRKKDVGTRKRKVENSPLATASKRKKNAISTNVEQDNKQIDDKKSTKENDKSNLKRKVPQSSENDGTCETKLARFDSKIIENQESCKITLQNSTVESKKYSLNFQMDKLRITKPFSSDLNIKTKISQMQRPEAYWVPNEWIESL